MGQRASDNRLAARLQEHLLGPPSRKTRRRPIHHRYLHTPRTHPSPCRSPKLTATPEWGALADHKAFEASPAYPPFLESFAHLLSAPPTLFHLLLPAGQFAAGPGPAPTTECISLFFDPAHDAAAYDANWAAFASAAAAVPSDCKGIVGGWGVEPHEHEKLGAKEGEKGPAKFFGAFIGWPSVESHMEFREKEEFPQIIKFLREGPVGIAVHHVRLQKYL